MRALLPMLSAELVAEILCFFPRDDVRSAANSCRQLRCAVAFEGFWERQIAIDCAWDKALVGAMRAAVLLEHALGTRLSLSYKRLVKRTRHCDGRSSSTALVNTRLEHDQPIRLRISHCSRQRGE